MLTVNDTVFTSVGHYSPDTGIEQTASMVETYADFDLELNTKLLRELITQLDISNKVDQIDDVKAILYQYDMSISSEGNSKLLSALKHLKMACVHTQPSSDVAEMLANQKQCAKSTALALADIQREVATNRTKANYAVNLISAEKKRAAMISASELKSSDGDISSHTSYAELWARMALAIKEIKGNYVDFYADLMQKYTEMYEDYNMSVQGAATNAVSAGDDGNNVSFNESTMANGYATFESKLNDIDLGSVKNWDIMTTEERKSMVTTLEPAFKVSDSGKIEFNLDQYTATPRYPSGIDKNGQVSTAGYQAWLASFNANSSALQSYIQAFAKRYSQASSTFDNLNKILSGAISSLAESAQDVLKALG